MTRLSVAPLDQLLFQLRSFIVMASSLVNKSMGSALDIGQE